MKKYKNDAWKKLSKLIKKNTKEIKVRPDIKITGRGCDRAVELHIGLPLDPRLGSRQIRHFTTTGPRNVGTMRELAKALNDACDFVDSVNPDWAKQHPKDDNED